MTEEEKKAIEIVKEIKNIKFKVTSSFYSSGTISLNTEEKEAIDTVLNLVTKLEKENEKKDREITKYKNMYEVEHEIHQKRNEQLDRKERGIEKAKQQLIEKDEIIKLMARKINEAYFEETDFYTWFEEIFGIIPKNDYSKKIVEYFEKLAKEKGE